jgi:hypothetical protein
MAIKKELVDEFLKDVDPKQVFASDDVPPFLSSGRVRA